MSEKQSWTIRPCEPEDWDFVRELRTDPANVHGFVYRGPISKEQHASFMARHAETMYIGVVDGKPQGFVGLTGPSDARECILCIDSCFHGKGLGKFLLQNMLARFPDLPAKVLKTNAGSLGRPVIGSVDLGSSRFTISRIVCSPSTTPKATS
jgi:ribosomal protein S18 acetylase RimI-like enzyme